MVVAPCNTLDGLVASEASYCRYTIQDVHPQFALGVLGGVRRAIGIVGADQVLIVAVDGVHERPLIMQGDGGHDVVMDGEGSGEHVLVMADENPPGKPGF